MRQDHKIQLAHAAKELSMTEVEVQRIWDLPFPHFGGFGYHRFDFVDGRYDHCAYCLCPKDYVPRVTMAEVERLQEITGDLVQVSQHITEARMRFNLDEKAK